MAEAMICITMSQRMAAVPTAEADAPLFDHGETEDKPRPVPSASRMSESAAATNAPAITAAQETPDECASFPTEVSANLDCCETVGEAVVLTIRDSS
jgi:hypothetical protein